MLELRNISKTYLSGINKVQALDNVSMSFRDNEFVAILGQSGSGKTTLLNIIGGLDRYDGGELLINSRSTKQYTDKDWDGYRNHSVGFVFQNYNLIPHQTVLANVELALTLSGVSKAERRKRAKRVLKKVGLSDQLYKKPNQMSGGQMQRVAIARALVNDPDILLADEPTGALDSKTSVQIMELIRDISKDRLVIMVTHNPKLAKEYANRLVLIKDGKIRKDTNPYNPVQEGQAAAVAEPSVPEKTKKKKEKKPRASMSFATALSLSFNNLLTKKGRTVLTSFAGSIGIIGIALILALSNGMQAFISSVEQDTLASYPLIIEKESLDLSQLLGTVTEGKVNAAEHDSDRVYKLPSLQSSIGSTAMQTKLNDLSQFKQFLQLNEEIYTLCTDIKYGYDVDFRVYKADTSDGVEQVKPNPDLADLGGMDEKVWEELIGNEALLSTQYDILAGVWPKNHNELILFVDENNEISDLTFYALGLADISELENAPEEPVTDENGEELPVELEGYEYSEFIGLTFKVMPTAFCYGKDGNRWVDKSGDTEYMKEQVDNAQELKIVGIARPKETAQSAVEGGTIGYMSSLTEYILTATDEAPVVKAQKKDTKTDAFTGLPFATQENEKSASATSAVSMPAVEFAAKMSSLPEITHVANEDIPVMTESEIYDYIDKNFEGEDKDKMNEFVRLMLKDIRTVSDRKELMAMLDELLAGSDTDSSTVYSYIQMMSKDVKLQLLSAIITAVESGGEIDVPTESEIKDTVDKGSQTTQKPAEPEKQEPQLSDSTYEKNLEILGVSDLASPSTITIYPLDFESKERVAEIIDEYNNQQTDEGRDENVISYTDYVSLIMSSVTQIIDLVTYALVAFVAISLVVSSIMIGIITYISVLERTKEIGILRSIGASKRDISRVFNCETIIVGLVSGVMGILLSLLLILPINAIINAVANISGLARLPLYGAVALIVISVALTVIAGFIPAKVAARKDPVKALRSE